MSGQISATATALDVVLRGAPGERVAVGFVAPASTAVLTVECTVPAGGAARVSVPARTCVAA